MGVDSKALEELGLSPKEVSIYLALLSLGPSTVSKIAERTGIDRTLCYSLLNKLIDRGYVSFTTSSTAKEFSAVNPSKLLSDVEVLQERLQTLMPELQALSNKKKSSLSVETFKGSEGVRWLLSDFMTQKHDAYIFGDLVLVNEVAHIHLEKYFRYLEDNNLFEYLLFPEGPDPGLHPTQSKYRTVPRKLLSTSAVWVYGDTTGIIIWSEPILTIIIQNKEVAESYRTYFKFLWKIGSKKGMFTKKIEKA